MYDRSSDAASHGAPDAAAGRSGRGAGAPGVDPLSEVLQDLRLKGVSYGRCELTRPWGIDLDSTWQVGRLSLKGERWSILAYTDGVTDDGGHRSRRSSGAQRLARFHKKNFHQSAEDLCQALFNDLTPQQTTSSLRDDQTVLVLCSG